MLFRSLVDRQNIERSNALSHRGSYQFGATATVETSKRQRQSVDEGPILSGSVLVGEAVAMS